MDFLRHYLLTILIFMPITGALALMFIPRPRAQKWTALGVTIGTFAASLLLLATFDWHAGQSYAYADEGGVVQMVQRVEWIKPLNIQYLVGIDGLNFSLVLLTTLICMLACAASWKIEGAIRKYFVLFLLLESSILGAFLSLDLFLFFVFFELSLVPVYFLIAIWGGPRKQHAALKFFLYSLAGSILLLIGIISIYQHSRWILPGGTFDLVKLASPDFQEKLAEVMTRSLARKTFMLLLVGFMIRLAGAPLHSWLLDAHAEAPTPLNMILTGVLLKIGGYGIFRIAYPLFPEAAKSLWIVVAALGAIGIVYGAMCALVQSDLAKLAGYSSVSLMGFVIMGAAMMTDTAMNGAMFMMIAHGISGAALFFIVGIVFDRLRHREISRLGGLFTTMPTFSGMSFVTFFAALGLPGLCGFIGELMVLFGTFQAARPGGILYEMALDRGHLHKFLVVTSLLAFLVCVGMVITSGYILWTIQRVFLGTPRPEYQSLRDLDSRELAVLTPLTILAILLGILPTAFFFLFSNQTIAAIFALFGKNPPIM